MAEAYRALVQSPRFQRLSGADFVFYDSHAGSGIPLDDFLCHDFRNATLLTTVRILLHFSKSQLLHQADQRASEWDGCHGLLLWVCQLFCMGWVPVE